MSGFVSLWTHPARGSGGQRIMVLTPERARQVISALSSTLDGWYEQAIEISEAAIPVTGNKARGLHLARSILQAKLMLDKISEGDDSLTPKG